MVYSRRETNEERERKEGRDRHGVRMLNAPRIGRKKIEFSSESRTHIYGEREQRERDPDVMISCRRGISVEVEAREREHEQTTKRKRTTEAACNTYVQSRREAESRISSFLVIEMKWEKRSLVIEGVGVGGWVWV